MQEQNHLYPLNIHMLHGVQMFLKISKDYQLLLLFNSSLAISDFCHLLIPFSNRLDPDQDRLKVGPNLDPDRLTL